MSINKNVVIQGKAIFVKKIQRTPTLEYDAQTVADQLSGYTNMSHFSKSFVKKFGVLPKDY